MKRILILFLACATLAGCKDDNEEKKDPTRTVLVYMIADNNLSAAAEADIIEMENGWDETFNGNLLVFLNTTGGNNTLYRIGKSTAGGVITSDIVKTYPQGSQVCTQQFLRQVIDEVMTLYPADSYGLDLWSHGRGWLPETQSYPLTVSDLYSKYFTSNEISDMQSVPVTPSGEFGYDKYNKGFFEVDDLTTALSPYSFDFIYMDACHMGSIECAYQMRDLCDYYISSAAETMKDGAPYDQMVSDMFSQPANVVGMAQKFYEYYDKQSGAARTATISVVDTDELEEVADRFKAIVTASPTVPFSSIQQYGRQITGLNDCMFDLEDFAMQTWGTAATSSFSDALSDAVIYKASTYMILNTIPVNHFCGLSCYIPKEGQSLTYSSFKDYDWAADSGLDKMLQ